MHFDRKKITGIFITMTCLVSGLPAHAGDTTPIEDNQVCDWQAENEDPLQAATCTCDDAYDYLEDYLANNPEPQDPMVIDQVVDTLQGACPCDADIERDVPAGLRLMDILVKNGIAFGISLDSVTRVCDLRAQGIAALNQAFSPGISQRSGGPGGEVSPH